MAMSRKERVLDGLRIEKHRITSAGKFEGATEYTPYFYSLWLDGDGDTTYSQSGEPVETVFNIQQEDIEEFPELAGKSYVSLYEDEQGFVTATAFGILA